MSLNLRRVEEGRPVYENLPAVYDFRNDRIYQLEGADRVRGVNLASTPWIGDLDGNGRLDLIYSSSMHPEGTGSRIACHSTGIRLKFSLPWGGYMGSRHDGIYRSGRPTP